MFGAYELEVLAEYLEKRDRGEFLTNLTHPTPGRLRDESVSVFDKRYLKKDDMALRSFFDPKEETEEGFRLAVKRCEADSFRRLNTVMKEGAGNTDAKNIELLAWLIDFKPRPYVVWLKDPVRLSGKDEPESGLEKPQGGVFIGAEEPDKVASDENGHPTKELGMGSGVEKEERDERTIPVDRKNQGVQDRVEAAKSKMFARRPLGIFFTFLIVLLMGGLIFLSGYNKNGTREKKDSGAAMLILKRGPAGCMFWKGDHYERGACDQAVQGFPGGVPVDNFRLLNLKKITDTATINRASIGHVWYFRSRGRVECFTAGGAYPLDTIRRLLPISAYIIAKYFHR